MSVEVGLFSITLAPAPVILTPIVSVLVPEPELVILPVEVILVVVILTPLAIELLLLIVTFPVPPIPPETVSCADPLALLLVKINPPAPVVIAVVLTVSPDVVLFSVIPVTFEPTPPLIKELPVPDPEFVMVPILFTELPEIVIPFAILVLF